MLELVARLGTFGISVLLATHLLDDVQQVCDRVVMIDAGHLVVSGETDALLERTGVVTVDVGHRHDELLAGLARIGMHAELAEGASSRSPSTTTTNSTRCATRSWRWSCRCTACRRVTRRSTTSSCATPGCRGRNRARPGAVYDRGYRPYEGPRGGRGAATVALYKASMRRAVGIRRSWRQKFAPFVLLGIVTIPAIVNVGIGYVTRDQRSSTASRSSRTATTSACPRPCCCSSPSSPPT